MINMISKKIAQLLIAASNTDPEFDQVEVYVYGLECFLNTGITIFILFVWGLITNTLAETCCWIIAFSVLRHHSGGLHAPTQFSCIFSSCLLCISNWIIIKHMPYYTLEIFPICFFCVVVCLLFAPTDTSKYELTKSLRKKEKLHSIFILIIGFIIAIVLRNSISISILYSDICVCMLILIKVFIRKVKLWFTLRIFLSTTMIHKIHFNLLINNFHILNFCLQSNFPFYCFLF